MANVNEQTLVRLERAKLEDLICYPHAFTNDYAIVSELSDSLDLDGICILPTRTIKCLDREFERADLYRAAFQCFEYDWTATLAGLVCDLRADLVSLAHRGDLVALHLEEIDPDVAYIGSINDIDDASVSISLIDSYGQFMEEPMNVLLKNLTKVEVGTRYLQALAFAAKILHPSKVPVADHARGQPAK